jgi:hypothetical protein
MQDHHTATLADRRKFPGDSQFAVVQRPICRSRKSNCKKVMNPNP